MAAYAALQSLMYIIKQIEHHPRPPISLDKTQVESLTEKVTFLQEFLEGYSHVAGYNKEADPLELRIADAAYAAEDVIESHIVDQIHAGSTSRGQGISSVDFFEGLQKVVEDMDLMKKEVMEIKEKIGGVQHHLMQKSSTPVASFRSSSNTTMVGFDDVLIEVMDKLTRGQLDRQIIPIVGMGGIGKTTLAENVYKNPVVTQHFQVRAWVTVSQEYRLRDILEKLQEGGGGLSQMNEFELGENLHKRLSGRRYLIIIDDIWDIQVWDQIRRFFPDNKNGSRIVITTRISDFLVSNSHVIKMGFLDKNRSWSLFSKIVFGEEGCPVELKGIGEKIVESCGGLPLSIVVVGGLLTKSEYTQEYWEYIAENLNTIVNSENDESCLKILYISYNQLPIYLKSCFLYMGFFPEDEQISVSMLIKQWVAEGFLKPCSGKILEETAQEYLKDLINRNLVQVHKSVDGRRIKYCYIHDLLRDLCLRESQKQRFYTVIRQPSLNIPQGLNSQRRIVIPKSTSQEEIINALQCMSLTRSLIYDSEEELPLHKFRLLRVMSRPYLVNKFFQEDMFKLVNSRCIFLSPNNNHKFPSRLDLLWNLQTLIFEAFYELEMPLKIWNMPQLRHLVYGGGLQLQYPLNDKDGIILENLQTLGRVINFRCCKEVVKRVPNIKKLEVCYVTSDGGDHGFNNFRHLQKLKSLEFACRVNGEIDFLQNLTFPHSLKKLELYVAEFQKWEDSLEKIGSLPCLEKLSLVNGSFNGCKWETVEGQFSKLKFLEIGSCRDLKYWITESSHFPCLERLLLQDLHELTQIPSEIGEIPTLESIRLNHCRHSIIFSAKKLIEEQEELYGEVGLQVRVWTLNLEKEDMQRLAGPNFHFLYSDFSSAV